MRAGNLLAALCFFFVFPRWGWRPMFFIGGMPALLALYVRTYVQGVGSVGADAASRLGAAYARTIASHWKLFLYLVVLHDDDGLRVARHAGHVSDVPQARLALHAAARRGDQHASRMSARSPAASLFGHFSDRIGRRRKAIISALLLAIVAIPAVGASHRRSRCSSSAAFVMQFMVQGAWGVIPAHINELVARFGARLPAGLRLSVRHGRGRARSRTSRRCSPSA